MVGFAPLYPPYLLLFVLALLLFCPVTRAQDVTAPDTAPDRSTLPDSRARVRVTVVAAKSVVAAGSDLPVAIILDLDPGWHVHTHHPIVPPELGDASFYIKAELKAKPGGDGSLTPHADFIAWPPPVLVDVNFGPKPVKYGVYTGRTIIYLPITIAANARPGDAMLTILATYQACNDRSCMAPVFEEPVELKVRIAGPGEQIANNNASVDPAIFSNFPVEVWAKIHAASQPTPPGTQPAPTTAPSSNLPNPKSEIPNPKFPASSSVAFGVFGWDFSIDPDHPMSFALLLATAAVGGLLLNFTPCVLPVIPLKIMSLSKSAGSRGRCLALGVVMSLGVVAFWLALAAAVGVIHIFSAANQLFQYPVFTIAVGIVIAVMAVAMCGLFYIQLPQKIYLISPKQDSLGGSFGFGIMTAVLSTPCTAPLMGAAAAWAVKQSGTVTCTTFGAIGVGMALPYLLLAAFPALVSRLPRTGPASELIKQVMGLLMLAAAAYFIGAGIAGLRANPLIEPSRLYWWPVAALVAAAGGWLAYRSVRILASPTRKVVFAALGVMVMAGSAVGAVHLTAPGPLTWVYYTPELLAQAQRQGQTVVLDFTAEWCLNCKVLEANVLDQPAVVAALRDKRVVPMKVDLTGNNVNGNKLLQQVNRVTIPALVVMAPDRRQTLNSDAYTVEQVVEAIGEAEEGKSEIRSPKSESTSQLPMTQ